MAASAGRKVSVIRWVATVRRAGSSRRMSGGGGYASCSGFSCLSARPHHPRGRLGIGCRARWGSNPAAVAIRATGPRRVGRVLAASTSIPSVSCIGRQATQQVGGVIAVPDRTRQDAERPVGADDHGRRAASASSRDSDRRGKPCQRPAENLRPMCRFAGGATPRGWRSIASHTQHRRGGRRSGSCRGGRHPAGWSRGGRHETGPPRGGPPGGGRLLPRKAWARRAPRRSAPRRSAPRRKQPERSAPDSPAPRRSAPARKAPRSIVPARSASIRLIPHLAAHSRARA